MSSRLGELSGEALSPEQQRILQQILDGPRGSLSGPFLAWIHSPGLAGPAQELGAFLRYQTRLPPRLSELAILATARWWRCNTEWIIHAPLAAAAGVSENVIQHLLDGKAPTFDHDDEAIVFSIAESLYLQRVVEPELYARGAAEFGEAGMVELIGLLGYYAMVSMTLNAFEMLPDDASQLPFGP